MKIKQYFTRKTITGIVIGLLVLIGLCVMKHPVLGVFSAAAIIAFVYIPAGKVGDWVKAALIGVATACVTYSIVHIGPIGNWLTKIWPATLWLIPLVLTIAAVGVYVARALNYPCRGGEATPKHERTRNSEEDQEDEDIEFPKIMDLSHHLKGEEKEMLVKYDISAGKVFVIYKGIQLFLRRGKDKIIAKDSERYHIEMHDGTILIVPASHAFTAGLGQGD